MSGLLSGSGSNIYPGGNETARKEKDEDGKTKRLKKKKEKTQSELAPNTY